MPAGAVWQHNNDLAGRGAGLVAGHPGTSAPQAGRMTAAMRPIRLPGPLDEAGARALERRLREQHRVIVPVTCCDGRWQWLRVSAQLYNTLTDYERLAAALSQVLAGYP
jgi:selenocysteine lyase/cysteine desulfurase